MKKKITQIIILLALFLHFTNLSGQDKTVVKGTFKNCPFDEIHLYDISISNQFASSKITGNGSFTLSAEIEQANIFKLYFDKKNHLIIILKPGDEVHLKGDMNDIYNMNVEGSENTAMFYKTLQNVNQYNKKRHEAVRQIENEKEQYLKKTITENSPSIASLLLLFQVDASNNMELLNQVFAEIKTKYPENRAIDDVFSGVLEKVPLEKGVLAPDIVMPNPEGELEKLSSLRGNYVLIDFWASWCGPCRRENPNMVKVYKKYHDKGFEIFGVSLDQKRQSWLDAIEKDGLTWTHVSYVDGWNCPAYRVFKAKGIPFTVLIDKEGKIVEKNLRGEKLEKKLEEIFGE